MGVMPILSLNVNTAPILLSKSEDAQSNQSELINNLLDTMLAHDNCIGLAAPQIGTNLNVFVIRNDIVEQDNHLVVINPVVVESNSEEVSLQEACMSLQGWQGEVLSPSSIKADFLDQHGLKQQMLFEGFSARVFRHEFDHLQGILYPMRVKPPWSITRKD